MSCGQTNGIPQGSVLMDFIAEILLSYADSLLTEKIKEVKIIKDYRIIRYRDDYRIFVNNPGDGDLIMKLLNEVLIELGMRLSAAKTKRQENIILSGIKPDKIALIEYTRPEKITKESYRKELLFILKFSQEYPNSGSVRTRLTHLYEEKYNKKISTRSEHQLLSILTEIAIKNPNSFQIIVAHMSRILKGLSKKTRERLFQKVLKKVRILPNAGLMEINLQRLMLPCKIEKELDEPLCEKVKNDNVSIFNFDWIFDTNLQNQFKQISCVDRKRIASLDLEVAKSEIRLFPEYNR